MAKEIVLKKHIYEYFCDSEKYLKETSELIFGKDFVKEEGAFCQFFFSFYSDESEKKFLIDYRCSRCPTLMAFAEFYRTEFSGKSLGWMEEMEKPKNIFSRFRGVNPHTKNRFLEVSEKFLEGARKAKEQNL